MCVSEGVIVYHIQISSPTPGPYLPGSLTKFTIDLGGQKGKVALMAVDKAIYALNAQNKLTVKQVTRKSKNMQLQLAEQNMNRFDIILSSDQY